MHEKTGGVRKPNLLSFVVKEPTRHVCNRFLHTNLGLSNNVQNIFNDLLRPDENNVVVLII